MLGVRWNLSTTSPLWGEEEEEGSGGTRCDGRRREEGEEEGGRRGGPVGRERRMGKSYS